MNPADWVLLARLVRPQGRKGEIIADLFTDFPNLFRTRSRIFLRSSGDAALPREMTIERHWLHQGRIVLKFQGIDSINDAETLRGLEVVLPATERAPLEEDAVYIGDLIGCDVIDLTADAAVTVGKVLDVERGLGGAPDLLVVQPPPALQPPPTEEAKAPADKNRPRRGKRAPKPVELLIPFAKAYLVSIDLGQKRVTMRLPQGLAALNTAAIENDRDG